MAITRSNLVRETTTTQGTGSYDLGGATGKYQTFLAGIGDGNTCYYSCFSDSDFEVGIGTLTAGSPDVLSRDTIIESSNSDAAVSWPASGTRTIILVSPAEKNVEFDDGGDIQLIDNATTVKGVSGGATVVDFALSGGGTMELREDGQHIYDRGDIASLAEAQAGTDSDKVMTAERVSDLIANLFWSTGDVKPTFKATADTGWVMMDDGTIGSAASGATTRANADTEALFKLLWDNCSDANCPVSGGRGASAQADFDADKTITLPTVLGRALSVAGSGASLTSRSLADTTGDETHTLTVSELPSHDHGGSTGTAYDGNDLIADAVSVRAEGTGGLFNIPDKSAQHSHSVSSEGGGSAHTIMQPTSFLNVMIKL